MDINTDTVVEEQRKIKNITWESCCFSINPVAVKYFIQVGVLVSLILTSLTMLIVNDECNSQRNWSGLLMVCLGVFLPNPKMVIVYEGSMTWIMTEIEMSQPHHLYDYWTRIMTCTEYFCIIRGQQTKIIL